MNASKKTSVLVADDDPRLLKLVQRNLELNGYRVLTAMDGTNALKMAEAEELDRLRGSAVNLTPTEFRIISFLARNAGRVVTQADLLTKVWGPEYKDEAHLLRVNIARLRAKVESDPGHPRYILTRPGIGYTLSK